MSPAIILSNKRPGWRCLALTLVLMLELTMAGAKEYDTFADYPGFSTYYGRRCVDHHLPQNAHDKVLLQKFRPHFILPPKGQLPIDFYADYLSHTVLRRRDNHHIVVDHVTPDLLAAVKDSGDYYLDLQLGRLRAAGLYQSDQSGLAHAAVRQAVVYGRAYHQKVSFPAAGGPVTRHFSFLKYNLVFAVSGLPARLPWGSETLLRLLGFNLQDWHELDNYVAATVVLDEQDAPVAVILAQHNHHRSFLVGRHLSLPADQRLIFDIAERSNELYRDAATPGPVAHRVIRWGLNMKYLLTGKNPPFLKAQDLTYGRQAGGLDIAYQLQFLSPCDPFYTAKMMLGERRRLFGHYIGRDGPPGADYYTIPLLLPMGNLLKASYYHAGDPEDIAVLTQAIDLENGHIDFKRLIQYGGEHFYRDLQQLEAGTAR